MFVTILVSVPSRVTRYLGPTLQKTAILKEPKIFQGETFLRAFDRWSSGLNGKATLIIYVKLIFGFMEGKFVLCLFCYLLPILTLKNWWKELS